MDWSTVQGKESRKDRWEDALDLFPYTKAKKFTRLRLIGPVVSAKRHWIDIVTKKGAPSRIPITCPDHNPETGESLKKHRCAVDLIEYPRLRRITLMR
jgi:hypothetical protein